MARGAQAKVGENLLGVQNRTSESSCSARTHSGKINASTQSFWNLLSGIPQGSKVPAVGKSLVVDKETRVTHRMTLDP